MMEPKKTKTAEPTNKIIPSTVTTRIAMSNDPHQVWGKEVVRA
jgi:hypothetical protein